MMRGAARYAAFVAAVSLASCGGGGSSGVTPSTTSVSSAGTTPGSTAAAAYTCPTSDTATASFVRGPSIAGDATRHSVGRRPRASQPSSTLLAVTYQRSVATRSAASLATNEQSAGATVVRTLDFSHANLTTHVLSVPASKATAVAASLRSQSGVVSVAPTGYRRHPATISEPFFTNDPYFSGFVSAGTFHMAPFAETATVPGEWDMHVIGLESAFAYSQAGNGSGIVNAAALGSPSVKIAIIDTGEDATHPELTSKITYQKCFITDTNNVQSTSSFTTDPEGHGTDVAGIAGAATNNGFGFVGAGGNVSLYGYRVFPTPDDTCASTTGADAQCTTNTADIAAAILDAVAKGANVISMSLGGDGCTNGVDNDVVEGTAVADALAANVIVVAAAGNDSSAPLEAPACDAGVIAVGASALGDGIANGTSSVGSATAPVEYVASYSDFGSPAAAAKSSSAWGIVAPGGDPSSSADGDNLHWIEHIWTSKPFQAGASDTTFAGECTDDFPDTSGTSAPVDCRTMIAGTSMATPHVAGAAALILSVNPSYQSPAAMKALLCSTADDIGDAHEGCGRLNVYRAMAKALGDPNPPA